MPTAVRDNALSFCRETLLAYGLNNVFDPATTMPTPEPATPDSATPEPATLEPATPDSATPEPATPEPAATMPAARSTRTHRRAEVCLMIYLVILSISAFLLLYLGIFRCRLIDSQIFPDVFVAHLVLST